MQPCPWGLGQSSLLGAKELWKTKAPNKCRFFVWLVLHARCWTADLLHRHGLQSDATCALYSQCTEGINHLLVGCVFSREIWFKILRRCGWQQISPAPGDGMAEWWTTSRKRIPKDWRKAFDSTIILVVWSLWLECNNRVFSVMNITCIHMRAEGPNIYMYRRREIYREPPGKIQ
jgi:hypothetical protein